MCESIKFYVFVSLLDTVCLLNTCIVSFRQIGVAYVTATSTALATAVGLNLYTKVPTHTNYCASCHVSTLKIMHYPEHMKRGC